MNTFFKLVGNENLKIRKQVGLRVCAIIILALAFLSPIIVKVVNGSDSRYYGRDTEWLLERIEREENRSDGSAFSKLYIEHMKVEYDAAIFFEALPEKDREWKNLLFYNQYLDLLMEERICDIIINNEFTVDDLIQSEFSMYLDKYFIENQNDQTMYGIEISEETVIASAPKIKAEAEALEKEIKEHTVESYYLMKYENGKKTFEYMQDELSQLQNMTEADKLALFPSAQDPSVIDTAAYNNALEAAKRRLEGEEIYLNGLRFLTETNPDFGSWQYRTVEELIDSIKHDMVNVPSTEDDFYGTYYLKERYGTYENFLTSLNNELNSARKAAVLAQYSLDYNIPINGMYKNSTKEALISSYSSAAGNLVILMIVIAGVIVSNEYTSGTIRLLLIRPRSRAKILASKLVSMYFWWFAMSAAIVIALSVESVLLFGIGDFFKNDLFMIGEKIIEIPSALTMLLRIITDIFNFSPFVLTAFLISVWIKRSTLPIALSIMGKLFSNTALTIALSINEYDPKWHLEITPFPYMNLSAFITNPAEHYVSTNSLSLFELIFGSALSGIPHSGIYDIKIGIAWMIAEIVLLTALSFVSFTKQQIKN